MPMYQAAITVTTSAFATSTGCRTSKIVCSTDIKDRWVDGWMNATYSTNASQDANVWMYECMDEWVYG